MSKLSCIVLTLNSARTLEKCLTSLNYLADEIIIVDGGSTDQTLEIAKKHGCKIVFSDSKRFDVLRNIGNKHASCEWIFHIDSDEFVTNELKEEIKKMLEKPIYDVYALPRKTYINGKIIDTFTTNPPDLQVRLFKKDDRFHYEREIHELLFFEDKHVISSNYELGIMRNPLLHLHRPIKLRKLISLRDLYLVTRFDAIKFYKNFNKIILLRRIVTHMTIVPLKFTLRVLKTKKPQTLEGLEYFFSNILKWIIMYSIFVFLFKVRGSVR
ncbi:MAG: glycosyltransferase family 2 protein [Nitrososphaerales archaeon]